MTLQTDGIVITNRRIKSFYFLLEIHCPSIAMQMKSGQFVMLKTSNGPYPLLRRPFSVYKTYPSNHPKREKRGCLVIIYKKVGRGTQQMAELRKGQRVNMIGPLGNGFRPPSLPFSNITLIGGGVGIVSLYPLAEALKPGRVTVFIGGKTQSDILCVEDFEKLNARIYIATEDGSTGLKGTVIDLLMTESKKWRKDDLQQGYHHVYACGPAEMLAELSALSAKRAKFKGFICQASLEARMACGFGACWGCVIKTRNPVTPYQRVCKEGPVFNLEDILWE